MRGWLAIGLVMGVACGAKRVPEPVPVVPEPAVTPPPPGDPDVEPLDLGEREVFEEPLELGEEVGGAGAHVGPVLEAAEITWTYRPLPPYPAAAFDAGSGDATCTFQLSVDAKGAVEEAAVMSCPPLFVAESRATLLTWRAAPTGKAVRVAVTVKFRME